MSKSPLNRGRIDWRLYSQTGSDQRSSEAWKVRRATILAMQPWCSHCRSIDKLEVHCRNGNHFDPNDRNFMVLCPVCHRKQDAKDGRPQGPKRKYSGDHLARHRQAQAAYRARRRTAS